MAVNFRQPLDYTFGTLSLAAAIGDTTINSSAFASLPNGVFTATQYLPIVLHNPAAGTHEVVWVTAHTGSATSVTVVRGKESTSAQAWPSGTQWICAPTAARDGLGLYTSTQVTNMTDAHVGQRVLETDTGLPKAYASTGVWAADIGQCLPGEVGTITGGGSVPTNATVLSRMGCVIGAAVSSGSVTVTFAKPFPGGFIGGLAGVSDHNLWDGYIAVDTGTTTGCKLWPLSGAGTPTSISAFYVVWGW